MYRSVIRSPSDTRSEGPDGALGVPVCALLLYLRPVTRDASLAWRRSYRRQSHKLWGPRKRLPGDAPPSLPPLQESCFPASVSVTKQKHRTPTLQTAQDRDPTGTVERGPNSSTEDLETGVYSEMNRLLSVQSGSGSVKEPSWFT